LDCDSAYASNRATHGPSHSLERKWSGRGHLVVETGAFDWSSASPLKDASWIRLDTSGGTARWAREEGHFVGQWRIT